jgi:hypothetical protein
LIAALMKLEGQIDLHGVKDETDLVQRFLKGFSRK